MIRYAKPTTVAEALSLLGEDSWRILAGGTDFYPAQGTKPLRENILDINGLAELRGIAETDSNWTIGARTSWAQVASAPLPACFDALRQAAREVGSRQIQNVATVAGNLCNASPAADGVPALLILDADVELSSTQGARHLPLGEFILGNRRTALQPGEMVTAIRIPKSAAVGQSAFHKLGARRYLVISIAMAAVRLVIIDGMVSDAAVAVGACAATAKRLHGVETAVIGRKAEQSIADAIISAQIEELTPIDDVRGTAGYRQDAAREIVARAALAIVDESLDKAAA
ncbi:MAG: xanthine dehydrogenase [Mesorhizobium sp. 61-13]|nr:xanthine dehydrogenase family protein subunit M [Mesorhizobium sp.]OJU51415.1 MAG: xanthine dehydrogenase [Mesorhizobium sp. 61-13]